jgi:ribosomal protein S18 acetylase RimI-like enzyme
MIRVMLRIERATAADADELARIAKAAFESDVKYGAGEPTGPPGYDSPGAHARWMSSSDYYKITRENRIVGGVIVVDHDNGRFEMDGIFVDPASHRQGIGSAAIHFLERQYPRAQRWTLGTPGWNTRTPAFYESLGYRCVGTDEYGGLRYEKRMT